MQKSKFYQINIVLQKYNKKKGKKKQNTLNICIGINSKEKEKIEIKNQKKNIENKLFSTIF